MRPGDHIRLRLVNTSEALAALAAQEALLSDVRQRCRSMYSACELAIP